MKTVTVARVGVALLLGAGLGFLARGDDAPAPVAAPMAATTTMPARVLAMGVVRPDEAPTARRGGETTVEFRARPGASCQAAIKHGNRAARRLPAALVDKAGRVAWRWKVESDVPPGLAQAVVVCSGGGRGQVAISVD